MASPPISIDVEGIPEMRAALKKAGGPGADAAIKVANKSAAQKVVDAALPNVPVGRTGNLKRSVRAMGSLKAGSVAAGKARVPYAAAIHWGEGAGNINHSTGGSVRRKNRNVRGRPFLWEAADRMLGQIVEEYEGEIDDLLDRTVRTA